MFSECLKYFSGGLLILVFPILMDFSFLGRYTTTIAQPQLEALEFSLAHCFYPQKIPFEMFSTKNIFYLVMFFMIHINKINRSKTFSRCFEQFSEGLSTPDFAILISYGFLYNRTQRIYHESSQGQICIQYNQVHSRVFMSFIKIGSDMRNRQISGSSIKFVRVILDESASRQNYSGFSANSKTTFFDQVLTLKAVAFSVPADDLFEFLHC